VSSPKRPRNERRQRERELRNEVSRVERLWSQLPGASATAPIDVAAPAVATIKARATPCPLCQGELTVERDRAESTPRGVLLALDLHCRLCHKSRTLWFRVAPRETN